MTREISKKGTIREIVDGDTWKIEFDGQIETIRLYGIDCPEEGQPFYKEANEFCKENFLNRQCLVLYKKWDRYGRKVARVFIEDQIDCSDVLMRVGLAWCFQKYCNNYDYFFVQKLAREEGKGIWSLKNPEAPWSYRHYKKQRKGN